MIPCQSDEMDEDHARQALRGAVIRLVILTISTDRKKPGPIAYFPLFLFSPVGIVLPQRREGESAKMETRKNLTKRKEIKKTQNISTRELSLPFSSCVLGFSFFLMSMVAFCFSGLIMPTLLFVLSKLD